MRVERENFYHRVPKKGRGGCAATSHFYEISKRRRKMDRSGVRGGISIDYRKI